MRTTGVRGRRVYYLLLFLSILLSSCIGNISTTTAMRKAAPKASPARTVTSFSDSLSCMDDLFLAEKVKSILISSEDIKDEAKRGKMGNGGTDMLISAISEISSTSNAVRYVGYKSSIPDFAALNAKHVPSALVIPDYYIVGSISQADDYILMNQQGLGAATSQVDTGYSYNDSVSVVAIDLNLFEVETGMQLPGITSRNSLAYTRRGRSGDLGGLILKTGVSFFVNFTRSEGPQQAVRTLLELSLIELMGKLTKLPYWDCLSLDIAAKEMYKTVAKWWEVKNGREKVILIQRLLSGSNRPDLYPGGVLNRETRAAIREFQAKNGLVPDGRISLPLFIKLKSEDKPGSSRVSAQKGGENRGISDKKKGQFKTEKIDGGAGDFGSVSSMAIGGDGVVHVAYFDPSKRSLKYGKKEGSSWSIKTVDTQLETDNPEDVAVSIAVDGENRPHILYSFRPEKEGAIISYASFGTAWKKEMIEMLSASADRVPGVSIFFSGSEVNLLYSGDRLTNVKRGESGWVANDSYDMRDHPDLGLEKIHIRDGKIYLSYSKSNELVTVWDTGKEWEERRVLMGEKIFNPLIMVDRNGDLHTVGFTGGGEIKHMVARKGSGTILKRESFKKLPAGGDASSFHLAGAISPDDTIHLLYSLSGKITNGEGGLYYLRAGVDGSKRVSKIEGGELRARTIAVAPSGKVFFTYTDKSSGDLLFGSSSGE